MPPVSEELTELLNAAEHYVPALALTRTDVLQTEPARPAEFEHHLIDRLRHHLSGQRHHTYFLAEARVTRIGYKEAGSYYWIVGYRLSLAGHEVCWVSRDFYIHHDSIVDFDVDVACLERRFGSRTDK